MAAAGEKSGLWHRYVRWVGTASLVRSSVITAGSVFVLGMASYGLVVSIRGFPVDPSTFDTIAKLGPIATGLAAIVALIVGLVAVTQKSRADRRDQWWKRTQWAIEQTFTDDEEQQALGFRVLQVLADSKLASPEEILLLASLTTHEIEPLAPDGKDGDDGENGE